MNDHSQAGGIHPDRPPAGPRRLAASTVGRVRGWSAALLLCLVGLLAGASAAAASTFEHEGTVIGCHSKLEADTSGRTLSATLSSCSGSLDPEAEVEGSWSGEEGVAETSFELGSATLSVFGQSKSMHVGYRFTAPLNFDELVETYEEVKELEEEGKRTAKQLKEAEAPVEAQLQKTLGSFEQQLVVFAAETVASQPGSGVSNALEHFESIEEQLDEGCEEGTDGLNFACSPYFKTEKCPSSECPTVTGHANVGDLGEGEGESDSQGEQEALCPVFNAIQSQAVFVCVPSYVAGNLEVGGKPLVILGGGALMAIPGLSGEATISSKTSIVQVGGAIVGYNVNLKAPQIAMAGGFLDALKSLELSGEQISVGAIDGAALLGSIKGLPAALAAKAPESLLHSQIALPFVVAARHTTVKATKSFALASNSTISGVGLGGAGGEFESGEDPTGESDGFGGSHGGLGGYTATALGTEGYEEWYTMEGRSPISDSPFKPVLPGDGGGGEAGSALGLSGGGVVTIESPKAEVDLEGRIDVSGFGTGLEDATSNGDHGGGGAGGSVYLTAKKLAGSGTIDADGGSHCDERTERTSCVNGGGGSGGGGRIATIYEEAPSWKGTSEAHGGYDRDYLDETDYEQFLGSGGAGTVFARTVKFKSNGEVQEGTGAYGEGILTIDGGRSPGDYPPPDGTPLENAWSAPHRKLVITGQARAYGEKLDYADIELTHGGVLTSGISSALAPIPQKLEVKAETLSVDASSRVTMTGRGYAGGSFEATEGKAEAAPEQSASNDGHGGSHGGAGGKTGAHENPGPVSGSTYDSEAEPALPGGGGGGEEGDADGAPGGGVLDVEAQTLDLNGVLSADGAATDGPTETEPAPYSFGGGAGAGGSLLVHATTIAGSGRLTALGGEACISEEAPLLPGTTGCNAPDGSAGAGGGGRVALYAGAACGWTGALSAGGGVDGQAERKVREEGEPEDAEAMRGGAGSVHYPAPAGKCEGGGSEGKGSEGGGSGSEDKGSEGGGSGSEGSGSGGGGPGELPHLVLAPGRLGVVNPLKFVAPASSVLSPLFTAVASTSKSVSAAGLACAGGKCTSLAKTQLNTCEQAIGGNPDLAITGECLKETLLEPGSSGVTATFTSTGTVSVDGVSFVPASGQTLTVTEGTGSTGLEQFRVSGDTSEVTFESVVLDAGSTTWQFDQVVP
ncbi:MAG TPA: hypothetical protein VMU32_02860, partial [Solirubrobacteraceae bacterium]|nr:hypothetical protein [Solirubrobacteraceae bacterium]